MRHQTHLKPGHPAAAAIAAVVITFLLGGGHGAAAGVRSCSFDGNRAILTIGAEPYAVTASPGGQRIVMEAFGHLIAPGKPMLPMKRFLVALPPGARALSVELLRSSTATLPGTYLIRPSAPAAFLPDMPGLDEAMRQAREEWDAGYRATYLSDSAFPESPVWLAGRGTLREYAYAAVAFCPFTYHPQSGRLEYCHQVEVSIAYDLPDQSGGGAQPVRRPSSDRASTERAKALFDNFEAVAGLYAAGGSGPSPLEGAYDYVIITTGSQVAAIEASAFPVWKAALGHSLRTVLITDPEIAGQPGADLAEQIRNFLRAHYETWGIEYVLFVGDYATVPMRVCYPDPSFHVYDPSNPGLAAPGTPTDYYYADLSYPDSVSWDSDRDGYPGEYSEDDPDFLAEVSVGRIPVNDAARITYTLNKLVAFEQDTGAWKNNVLHAGAILFFENQDYSGYPFVDGATCIDSIETGLMSGKTITHFSEQTGLVRSSFSWPALTQAAFTSAWGSGEFATVNWSGHGWCDGAYRTVWSWDDGDGVPESGNGEMRSHRFIGLGANVDDDHPSIVFAISCNVGYPDPNPYGNLGIDMLTLPGWGPSAGVVSSARPAAVSGDWKAEGGGTEQICYDFNRYVIAESERVGDALYDGKFYATENYGWDHVYEYMNLYNFNLFGDPALAVGGAAAGVAAGGWWRPAVTLDAVYPNPSASSMSVRFSLAVSGRVLATVHDVRGREVARLIDGLREAGIHAVTWNATGEGGQRLAPGVFFVAVEAGGHKACRKAVVLSR